LFIIRLFLRANKDFQFSPSLELPLEIAAAESCLEQSGPASGPAAVKKKSESAVKAEPAAKAEPALKFAGSESGPEQADQSPKPAGLGYQPVSFDFKPINFAQIEAVWPKVLAEIKSKQSSLLAVLKTATLKSIDDNCLVLALGFKFHKDNLENPKNANLLASTISGLVEAPVSISVILEKNTPKQSDAADLAMEVFGPDLA